MSSLFGEPEKLSNAPTQRKFKPQERWEGWGGEYSLGDWSVRRTRRGKWRAYKMPFCDTEFDSRDEAMVAVQDNVTWNYALLEYDRDALERLEAKLRARGSPIFSRDTPTAKKRLVSQYSRPLPPKTWRRYQHISTEAAMEYLRKAAGEAGGSAEGSNARQT